MSGQADSQQNIFCNQVEAQMVSYLKGGVSPAERRIITRHLSTCDRCALAFRDLNVLEAELKAEAARHRPQLSPAASQRIQQQVYRRMRLSLVWQRLFQVVKTSFAVASFLIFVGVAGVLGYQWLQFIANPEPVPGMSFEETGLPAVVKTAVPAPALAPTPAPIEQLPLLPLVELDEEAQELAPKTAGVPIYWQHIESPMPGEAPHQITRKIVETSLAGESDALVSYFVAMGNSWQEPTLRMWSLFSWRCSGDITARDFSYRQLPTKDSPMTAVYIFYNDQYTGEIKFRYIKDNWYPVYTNPPYLNMCLKSGFVFPSP